MADSPLDLFPPPIPGRIDTSRAAAASLDPDHLTRVRAAILRRLRYGSLTADELDEWIGATVGRAAARRLTELHAAGMVERSGTKRPTRTGRMAHVWQLTEFGRLSLDLHDRTET